MMTVLTVAMGIIKEHFPNADTVAIIKKLKNLLIVFKKVLIWILK